MSEYSEYNEYNRLANIDGIECKIINHLVHSNSENAKIFWKLLKYDDKDVLSNSSGKYDIDSAKDRWQMVDGFGGSAAHDLTKNTRVFLSPFVDDAWEQQCSSVYIYVDSIYPLTSMSSLVTVGIDVVTHNRINTITTNTLKDPVKHPNDFYKDGEQEEIVVMCKSRETLLLKSLISELNGLFIDGVGYLQFNSSGDKEKSQAVLNIYNRKAFFGHKITFSVQMSGISENPSYDW